MSTVRAPEALRYFSGSMRRAFATPAAVMRGCAMRRSAGHYTAAAPARVLRVAAAPARKAPTAMIFVPGAGGISHNEAESAEPEHLEAGANVLLHAALQLAGGVK